MIFSLLLACAAQAKPAGLPKVRAILEGSALLVSCPENSLRAWSARKTL